MGMKLLIGPCPECRGSGLLGEDLAICPIMCDYCYGSGEKPNLLVMLVWIIVMVVLTIGPFVLVWVL